LRQTCGVINVTRASTSNTPARFRVIYCQVSSIGRSGALWVGALPNRQVGASSEVLTREVGPLGLQKLPLIEPGASKLINWSIMSITQPSEPYKGNCWDNVWNTGPGTANKEPGDPTKAAPGYYQNHNMENPPFRLLLGKDAVMIA